MEKQEDLLRWDDRFILGIQIIDKQREKLFKMVNDLYFTSLETDVKGNPLFEESAHELISYMNYHLITEERLMLLLDYNHTYQHKERHNCFMEEVTIKSKLAASENRTDLCHFFNYLKNEGFSHFAIYDKEFASHYLDLRESGKLKNKFTICPRPAAVFV